MKCLVCVMVCYYLMNCFTLTYPICFVWLSYLWLFSFAMIINLLMGADARGPRGQQGTKTKYLGSLINHPGFQGFHVGHICL